MGFIDKLAYHQTKEVTSKQIAQMEKNPLFIHHPGAIFMINITGQILSINHSATTLLGYSITSMKPCLGDWVIDQTNEKIQHHLQQALHGKSSSFDCILIHQEGYPILVNMTMILANINETDFIYCVCKDLRTLKEYENIISKLYDQLLQVEKITNIGSSDYDVAADQAYWSNQTYQIFGIDDNRFISTQDSMLTFFHPKDVQRYKDTVQKAILHGKGFELEYRIMRSGCEERTVFQRTDVMLDETRETIRLMSTIQDITEQANVKTKLIENEKQMQSVTDRLHVGIWSYDARKKEHTFCSRGIEKIYGVNQKHFLENTSSWFKFVHPEDLFFVLYQFKQALNGEEMTNEHRIIDANGNEKWLHHQVIPYKDAEGNLIRLDGIITDITEKKAQTDTLAFNANHDHLTKLPNRRYFEKEVTELMHESKQGMIRFAIFYLDLDRFKLINDTLGHEMGDKLLISVTNRLNSVLEDNAFLARLGGDEFAICLKNTSEKEAMIRVADQIIKEMEKPFYLDETEVTSTTSIGICLFPTDGEDLQTLLKRADLALYHSKEQGRGNWQLYSSMKSISCS